jgi:hypothetical protein
MSPRFGNDLNEECRLCRACRRYREAQQSTALPAA